MPTKLLVIRHGQTEWNRKKRYCGWKDLGLNANGKKQALRLKKVLKTIPVYKIYSSDRTRALQTAEIAFKGWRIEKIPALREMHFGAFEGLTYDEIMQKWPVIYKKWLKDPYKAGIPKGESLRKFKQRVLGAFKKIIRLNKNKTVAVVCHGGTISIFLNHILEYAKFWQHIPKPGSITIIEYNKGRFSIALKSVP